MNLRLGFLAACVGVSLTLPARAKEPAKQSASSSVAGTAAAAGTAEQAESLGILQRIAQAKCRTAICSDPGFMDSQSKGWLGIEPLVEFPLGATLVVLDGKQGLRDYLITHPLSASFKGGFRVWILYDVVGLGVYYSTQSYRPNEDPTLKLRGSTFEYPASQIRRPYPGAALTFLGGATWIGFDIDELRNSDTENGKDPNYPRNWAIDRAFSFTFGISPANVVRDLLGLATTPETQKAPGTDRPQTPATEPQASPLPAAPAVPAPPTPPQDAPTPVPMDTMPPAPTPSTQ